MSRPLRFVQGLESHTGKVRTVNEDSLVARPEQGLWAVCDGMGGHENGQWASRAIAESLNAAVLCGDFDKDASAAALALHDANRGIYDEAVSRGISMGSTAAVLLIEDSRFAALWVGDSRIYLLRAGALHQLTRDHTQVADMVERGLLAREDARGHPMAHVLSRAVGVQPKIDVDVVIDEVQAGDIFLLCSDGLTGPVADGEIAAELKGAVPQSAAHRLVELCLSRGAPDNVTVVMVRCDETTLASEPAA